MISEKKERKQDRKKIQKEQTKWRQNKQIRKKIKNKQTSNLRKDIEGTNKQNKDNKSHKKEKNNRKREW